ncbi:GAF domain-containing protein [Modestobacter marinus]|uniref:GAF domain-containing protein n=1 Tax=Modestobacter marinus TaxID=477641 RepID=A0A846M180_9ACTN|nr:ANTAR domain-containing protein [Modestobacter marinus]NIH69419.1 hypothetical protein [Modestobacter marinus]GGL73588.1 GAF domain-containing protein [Modestobacter marinus]
MNGPGPSAQRFAHELDQLPPAELRGPEMLAVRLARACVAALPVDGAGLSIHDPDGLRTPIGASDPLTSRAERLQFTHGAGPCLRAHDDGVRIAFDEGEITRNWPELHDALTAETPFRAVLSVPLLPPLGPLVVLDLYVHELAALPATDREDVDDVVIALTRAMVAAALGAPVTEGQRGWWDGPDALRRARVWQATGMVDVALGLDTADALAVLKAHAFATDRLVDDVAEDLVSGRLSLTELRTAVSDT